MSDKIIVWICPDCGKLVDVLDEKQNLYLCPIHGRIIIVVSKQSEVEA